jgi:hypothetical protein
MTTIPIIQTILASLAFAFSNWKKLIEVSVFPFFMMTLSLITFFPMVTFQSQSSISELLANLNFYHLIYALMFIYGYIALVINIYRMVVAGNNSIAKFGLELPSLRFGRFFLLFIVFNFAQLPIIFSPYLIPVIYFLVIPLLLNLVSIANDVPYKKIKLQFNIQSSVMFICLGIPFILILMLFMISGEIKLILFFQVLSIYWTAISSALCYRVIVANNSAQNL